LTYWKKVIEREDNSRNVVGTSKEIEKRIKALVFWFLALDSRLWKTTDQKSILTEQKAVRRRK
jgi:hypothetical protein